MPSTHQTNDEIRSRKAAAGKFGFILGCIAAIAALAINLYRTPRPLATTPVLLAVLMAALNIPLGIGLGLLGERLTRPNQTKPKK
jgi:hypothetical protein